MNYRTLSNLIGDRLACRVESKTWYVSGLTEAAWRKSFVGAFLIKYRGYTNVLDYMCEALGLEHIAWSDLTKVNLKAISEYLFKKVSPNTATTYVHVIEALLNEYSEEGCIPVKHVNGIMRTKRVPSQHIALTAQEVEAFDAYKAKNDVERDIKALFMRACYTGARCSDVMDMSMDNIHDGILSYVSKKTSIESNIPVHENLKKYLLRKIKREYSAKTTSAVVRRIAKAVGITGEVSLFVNGGTKKGEKWEFVTMHTARRSFCTQLAQMGVNVETIRALAGHTTSTMTDRYIVIDGKKPGADAMRFFRNAKTA